MTIDTLLTPLEVMLLEKEHRKGVEEGRQEGRQEGLVEAVKLGLELRFGGDGMALFKTVGKCSKLSILTQAQEAIRSGRPLEEIQKMFIES